MTPETKGQPEPVACPGPVLYQVVGRDPDGADEVELISFEPSRKYADLAVAHAVEAGWRDVQARPLYDYDVPALLESREKLVEALAQLMEITHNIHRPDGSPDHDVERANKKAREALAAAREES